jgi:hypothetical protein
MELIIGTLIITIFVCFLAYFVLGKINIYAQNIHTHIGALYRRVNDLSHLEQRIIDLEKWNEDKNKHIFSLEQKLLATDLSLSDLVVNTQNKTKQLEERLIALERSKQSEIRANYNMDFTHINTDI